MRKIKNCKLKAYNPRLMSGFSMIELLVVIAIIGILSAIILTSLNSARVNARNIQRITNLRQIENALELYFTEARKYPPATTVCNTPPTTSDNDSYGLQILVTKGGITQMPRDPQGQCYVYATSNIPAPQTFHLGATLEDKNNAALGGDSDTTDLAGAINQFNGTGVGCLPLNAGMPFGYANNTETCYDRE